MAAATLCLPTEQENADTKKSLLWSESYAKAAIKLSTGRKIIQATLIGASPARLAQVQYSSAQRFSEPTSHKNMTEI